MSPRPLLIVVLAAGKGTRMRSALPKVLHEIAGRSMLAHVLALARRRRPAALAVVIGPGMEAVRAEALREAAPARGLRAGRAQGHGGCGARSACGAGAAQGRRARAVRRHAAGDGGNAAAADRERSMQGAGIAVLGLRGAPMPTGYGRLLIDPGGWLHGHPRGAGTRARASAASACATRASWRSACADLRRAARRASATRNAKGEYYLTDAVAIARGRRAVRAGRRRLRGGGGAGRQLARAARRRRGRLPGARPAQGDGARAPR